MFGFKTKSQFELFLIILISIILVYLIIVYIYKPKYKTNKSVSIYKKHYNELPTDPAFMRHTLSDSAIRFQNILFSNIMSTIGNLTYNDIINNPLPLILLNEITTKAINKLPSSDMMKVTDIDMLLINFNITTHFINIITDKVVNLISNPSSTSTPSSTSAPEIYV